MAVLNFANITGNAADDWIGQGIAESLTADLTRIKSMTVVAREQIFELQRSLSELGRSDRRSPGHRDGAPSGRLVTVSGAYQRLGERIRITAQAIDVATGPAARHREGRWPPRRSLRAAGPARQRAHPRASSVEVRQQDLRGDGAVGTRVDRGLPGVLARHAQPAAGRARVDGARDCALRAGARARSATTSRRWSSSPVRSSSRRSSCQRRTCWRKSLALADRALSIRPDDADAHVQRGDTLLAMGRPTRRSRRCSMACACSPIARPPTAASRAPTGSGKGRSTQPSSEFERDAAPQSRGRLHAPAAGDALHAARRLRRPPSVSRARRSGCRIR